MNEEMPQHQPLYSPEQLVYKSQAPSSIDQESWFTIHQKELLLLANTEYGRDLLLIDYQKNCLLPIIELGVNYVIFDATKTHGPRKRIGKFHSKSKFASVIRTRWKAVQEALNRINLLYILSLPKLVVNKSGLYVPVPAGAATITAYPNASTSSPMDGHFILNYLASGPGALPATGYGLPWATFRNFTTSDTDDDCDWSGSSSNYYEPYSWVLHKGMKTYTQTTGWLAGWEQADCFTSPSAASPYHEKMYRSGLNFTTSAIGASSTIDSGYVHTKTQWAAEYANWESNLDDPQFAFYSWSPGSTSAMRCADWDEGGTTAYTIAGDYGDFGNGTTFTWTLTATGESGINKTGITSIMGRTDHDAANSSPSMHSYTPPYAEGPGVVIYYADYTGTTSDPYLSVTYTLPTTAAVTGEIGDGATEQEVRSAT